MIDEPVQNAWGSFKKLNSAVDHSTHSSAQVLRCLGDQGQPKGELQYEVAIARNVDAVGRDVVEAQTAGHVMPVDRQAGASHGGSSQREDVHSTSAVGQPAAVAFQLFAITKPIVCSQHGLRALQVGVSRQDYAGVSFGPPDKGLLHGD